VVLEPVELNTFGALIRFAMDLERRAGEFYRNLASGVQHASAANLFSEHVREYARRLRLLEDIRQRNINEVLLEPISGMDSESYVFATNFDGRLDIAVALDAALDVETKIREFYNNSLQAAGLVLGEVGRVFRRFSDENREREKALSSLRSIPTT